MTRGDRRRDRGSATIQLTWLDVICQLAGKRLTMDPNPVKSVEQFASDHDADLYVASGQIAAGSGSLSELFIDALSARQKKRPAAHVFLTTYGGNPDAAYRMGRCLRDSYDEVHLLLAGPCKSAGALVALCADQLAFSPLGELGPLDIQMAKPDELMLYSSGLDITNALSVIKVQAFDAFEDYLYRLTVGSGGSISTKAASEIAAALTGGLFGPITNQVDPLRLGEADRALTVAREYGHRLGSSNLKPDCLQRLVFDYPTHSFVVDKAEANELFYRVRDLTEAEAAVAQFLKMWVRYPAQTPFVHDLMDWVEIKGDEDELDDGEPEERGGSTGRTAEAPEPAQPGEPSTAEEVAEHAAPSSNGRGEN